MNKRELSEIKRRLHSEKCATGGISGCYVSEKGEIISRFENPSSLMAPEELDKYLAIFRKVLSGGIGKNLISVPFTSKQVEGSPEHDLLTQLKAGTEGFKDALERLYEKITSTVSFEGRYAILVMRERYDVVHKGRDESAEVFPFVLCAVCPVKETKAGLCYDIENKDFRTKSGEFVLNSPKLGFMFPSFDDRTANIYSALYFTKDPKVCRTPFTDALFNAELPMAAEEQKTTFSDVLSGSLGDECTYEVVREVREHIVGVIEDSEQDKYSDDAPVVGKGEIKTLLSSLGVSEDRILDFDREYDECVGKGVDLDAGNLIDRRRFVIKTPDAVVKVDPDKTELVSVEYIDGVRYILIRIEKGVEVNGIDVKVKKED